MQLIYLTPLSWGKLRKKPATKWFDKYFAPIPKFNQRFARQHDVGPPPQFLEASPDSGIAHHLSGTNSTNFAENLQKNRIPAEYASGFDTALYSIFTFIAHCWVCHPHTLHTARLLDPCYKTGRREEDVKRASRRDCWTRPISLANQGTMLLSPNCQTKSAPRAPITAFFLSAREQFQAPSSKAPEYSPCETLYPLAHAALFRQRSVNRPPSSPSSHSVPSMQVQVLLTCLSAFFSTFLRSTFPLSVFMSYLDLAEIYQLLYAEITINVTLKEGKIWEPLRPTREFHPLCCSFPTDFQSHQPHLTPSSKGASV